MAWRTPFIELPPDNEIVWIRVLTVFGDLTTAQYNEELQEFTCTISGLKIPAYKVSRWSYNSPNYNNELDELP